MREKKPEISLAPLQERVIIQHMTGTGTKEPVPECI